MTKMFDFFNDIDNYSERKVDRFEKDDLIIDTCRVSDGKQDYETAVSHPDYHNSKFIVVEAYSSKEEAQEGHDKWIAIMIKEPLPDELIDCCNAQIGDFYRELGGDVIYKKENK
jgi:hypothetical protein